MNVQGLEFELIKKASFNEFDGVVVVEDLKKHKDLWRGVVMDRGSYGCYEDGMNLIKLRDIEDDCWNVDTLYILAVDTKTEELKKLAEKWEADEVSYMKEPYLGGGKYTKVLRVWWD